MGKSLIIFCFVWKLNNLINSVNEETNKEKNINIILVKKTLKKEDHK